MSKVYYTYDQIHELVAKLALRVSDFKPDIIVAIGGGGLIPGRILRTFLRVPVLVVTVESYSGEKKGQIFKRQWIEGESITGKRILVVDELNDTGSTLAYCVRELAMAKPAQIAVAVVHNKNKEKDVLIEESVPYFVGEHVEDNWIVYPWE